MLSYQFKYLSITFSYFIHLTITLASIIFFSHLLLARYLFQPFLRYS